MSEHTQKHEGPWRKLNEYPRDERDINEYLPYRSVGWLELLQQKYGEENVRVDMTAYEAENEARRAAESAEFALATEGRRNWFAGGGYRTDDGIDLTGKIIAQPVSPKKLDILLSPDVDDPRLSPNRIDLPRE